MQTLLEQTQHAYISRYALGRDYHKVIRRKLQQLAERIEQVTGPFGYRAFTDSAPVMEKPLAQNAGLGWIGKHTNLIHPQAGSWFFLGELYTDLPLPLDTPAQDHCGTCQACLDICPTQAIVAPYELDARRCISYLTIELRGPIPVEFRPLLGNRIYGCDDCQLVCPWNRFAQHSLEVDFAPRHGLRDTPYRLCLLAEKHRRGPGQCPDQRERRARPAEARRTCLRTGTRACALGLGPSACGTLILFYY
jgi:epoxyqueuosine reductase